MWWDSVFAFFFFFNDTATTEIYTLSLHDALPISTRPRPARARCAARGARRAPRPGVAAAQGASSETTPRDRKSTRLNSSHSQISYAVFCLKKKKAQKAGLRLHATQLTTPGNDGRI